MRLFHRKEKKEKKKCAVRVWPLQVSVPLHSAKTEGASETGAGDKVASAKRSRISSET